MKLIIDIPEKVVTAIQNGEDYRYDIHTTIAQGIPYEERPQGEWKKHGLCFECPKCHCGCMFTIVDKIVYGELNFCPNCGADMRGGTE